MKKMFLASLAVCMAIGLHAEVSTVETGEHTQGAILQKAFSEQRVKNLNEAVKKHNEGKASQADKELIMSEYEPFIKKLQGETVYGFKIEIDNPIFVPIAALTASLPTVATTLIDFYMIKYCTNDISKMTLEDLANIGATKGYSPIVNLKYASESQVGFIKANKIDYIKFVHAARAFNCSDTEALSKYLETK